MTYILIVMSAFGAGFNYSSTEFANKASCKHAKQVIVNEKNHLTSSNLLLECVPYNYE